jgi:hypothetical protein
MPLNPALRPIILDLALKWSEREPKWADRIAKGAGLVEGCSYIGNYTWAVLGSQGHTYHVKVDPRSGTSTCTCPDYRVEGNHCKHRWAAALAYQARKVRARRTFPQRDPRLEEVPGGWIVVYLGRALCGTDLYRYLGPKEKARVFPEQKGLLQKVSREVDFRGLPTEVEVLLQRGRVP